MAIASVGTLGTSVNSTAATTFNITTATNALASGDFAILTCVTANVSTGTGPTNDHIGISQTTTTGKWCKLSEYTQSAGVAADGLTTSVWLFLATAAVPTGTVFTVKLSASITQKAASLWKFTKTAGNSIRVARGGVSPLVSNSQVSTASGFGSAAFTGMASAARLWFRGMGKKAKTTTQLTVSTGFTAVTNAESAVATAAVCAYGEFIIATATGETSNPTLAVTGNSVGQFLALEEYTPSATAQINVQWQASTTTCFKDVACTTPVSADGDAVLGIKDANTGLILATQPTAALAPLYRLGGGHPYLENDGTKTLLASGVFHMGDNQGQAIVGAALRWDDLTGNPGGGALTINNGGTGFLYTGLRQDSGTQTTTWGYDDNGFADYAAAGPSPLLSADCVLSAIYTSTASEILLNGVGNGLTNAGPWKSGGAGVAPMGGPFVATLKGRLYGFRIYQGQDATTHTAMVTALQALYPAATRSPRGHAFFLC